MVDDRERKAKIIPGHMDNAKIHIAILGMPEERAELLSAIEKTGQQRSQESETSLRLYHASGWLPSSGPVAQRLRCSVFAESPESAREMLQSHFGEISALSLTDVAAARRPR